MQHPLALRAWLFSWFLQKPMKYSIRLIPGLSTILPIPAVINSSSEAHKITNKARNQS